MRKFTALSVVVCMICLFVVAQQAHSATTPTRVFPGNAIPLASTQAPYQDSGSYEPYTGEQLDNLLAPVALYPDPLLAQVLLATTFPDQIDDAAHYINDNGPNGIDYQNWDVSVKAVAHYPSVLSMLDTMLDWTTALGQAYVYQSTDVMTSVQRLRGLAYSQGNLVSTPQQQVIVDGGYIQIDPAQPQVIYVPVYDPGVIYERRVYSPGVGFGGFFNFGSGFAIGAWLNYDLDWGSHRVVYDGWGGGGIAWRQRSRPFVQINNVYVNNRYVNVNVNRTVVNRPVNYDNVNRFNSVHHDVNYDNRARLQPNRGANQPGAPRGGFQPRQQNNGPQPSNTNNGRQSGNQRSFNPSDRNQPPANGTQQQPFGGRATDRGVRNQPPATTPEQPARNSQQQPTQHQQQPNQRPFAYGSRNQQQGPQGAQQNQNRRIVPNQQQPQRQSQPTVGAPPQQNNRSFNPGAPNNNQPPAGRLQPPARPAPPTPTPPAAPAPAAQPAPHTPSNNAPSNDGSRGRQGQGQGQERQRGGGHDGGKNDGKN